jgi:hypothetical protein
MKIRNLIHKLFNEENGNGGGGGGDGGGGTLSPFQQFLKQRADGDGTTPPTETPKKTEEKPAETPPPGSTAQKSTVEESGKEEDSLFSLAKIVASGLKPETVKPTEQTKKADEPPPSDDDDVVAEVLAKVGAAPDANAGTNAQFEYVKKTRDAFRSKITEINAELKKMRDTGTDKIDKAEYNKLLEERRAVEEARKKDAETIEALKTRLAQFDLREDPDYQEKYVKPIRKSEGELMETIQMIGGADAEELQSNVVRVLSIQDDKEFRAAATELAEQMNSPLDGQELRSRLFSLRKLYVEQQVALARMPDTQKEIFARKRERQAVEAAAFLETKIVQAAREMREVDPMIQMMETGPLAKMLERHHGVLSQVDSQIDTIIKDDIIKRGAPESKVAQVVVMAKQRMRERLVFGALVEDYIQQTEDYNALKSQYQRLTGKTWAGSPLPEKKDAETGEKVGSLAELFRRRAS